MPPAKPTGPLTTLSDLAERFGRDVRYWSGYVDGMDLPTFRGPKNAKAVDERGLEKIEKRQQVSAASC
jgi:hypothetical protein